MSNAYGQESQTGFKRLAGIYKAIEQGALSSPWAKDPYAIRRRQKGHSIPNDFPTHKAKRILQRHDPEFHRIAARMEDESDGLWLRERKCERCGLKYEPLPDSDNGLCILCVMEVKKA